MPCLPGVGHEGPNLDAGHYARLCFIYYTRGKLHRSSSLRETSGGFSIILRTCGPYIYIERESITKFVIYI